MRTQRHEKALMLSREIEDTQRQVRTDAYQMSIGELVSMYQNSELVIDPEFQRLFRWSDSQKSRLIESILLGIPLPSIFVFERDDGSWELIDGLQRISTILEFMGELRSPDGGRKPPSILEATKYLPSLHNVVWEKREEISGTPEAEQEELDKSHQLRIRRARIGVEILKRPSDNEAKFDLFQRLNAGGTLANSQELRNCIMLMVDVGRFNRLKASAEQPAFLDVLNVSEDGQTKQRHLELATRYLVLANLDYDGKLDVEEFVDNGIVRLMSDQFDFDQMAGQLDQTFEVLNRVLGKDALKRWANGSASGKVGLVGLEVIAVGIGKNLPAILARPDSDDWLRQKIVQFWDGGRADEFTSSGMRGTTRISRTVPFGAAYFAQ